MKTMKLATKIFLAVIGVLLAAAGIVCLADPMGAVTTVAWVVGLVLLISGITTAIYYFVFGSFLVFAFPTSRVFIVLYGMLLILVGLSAAAVAFAVRHFVENKAVFTGVLIVGLIAVVLGIVTLTSDTAGAVLIAIPVGLALLLMGIGYIALDARLIRSDKAGETPKYFKDVDDTPGPSATA